MLYLYFCVVLILKDKIGGSADVFRTVGEKWRGLEEQSREEYRKQAKEDCGNLTLQPSNSERALKIINNMIREVHFNSHINYMHVIVYIYYYYTFKVSCVLISIIYK